MVIPGGRHTPRTTHCWVGVVVLVVLVVVEGSSGSRLSDVDLSVDDRPGFFFEVEDVGRCGSGIGLVGRTPVE